MEDVVRITRMYVRHVLHFAVGLEADTALHTSIELLGELISSISGRRCSVPYH